MGAGRGLTPIPRPAQRIKGEGPEQSLWLFSETPPQKGMRKLDVKPRESRRDLHLKQGRTTGRRASSRGMALVGYARRLITSTPSAQSEHGDPGLGGDRALLRAELGLLMLQLLHTSLGTQRTRLTWSGEAGLSSFIRSRRTSEPNQTFDPAFCSASSAWRTGEASFVSSHACLLARSIALHFSKVNRQFTRPGGGVGGGFASPKYSFWTVTATYVAVTVQKKPLEATSSLQTALFRQAPERMEKLDRSAPSRYAVAASY